MTVRDWTGVTRQVPPRRGRKPKTQVPAIRMRRGVSVGPRCIQAVKVRCAVRGVYLVLERPVQMRRRKMSLQNSIVDCTRDKTQTLFLTNIGNASVHLNRRYVVGTASTYNGPLHAVVKEAETTPVLSIRETPRDTAGEKTTR